jgi:zinc transport system permease protein
MSTLVHLLSFEFIRHALEAGLLASVLCGVVGTFVVVRRLVFISGGISHAAFGGLGVCYWLGVDYRWGAGLVATGTALALAGSGRGRGRAHDTLIGVLWALGMATGIVFLHWTPGYAPNLMTYLFGNILAVTASDVRLTAGLVAIVVLLAAAFWKELVATAFDEPFAAVQGVRVRLVTAGLMVAVALAVVFLIQLVGTLLVIALLTIPPAIALRLSHDFLVVMVLASLGGAAMTVGGLAISYAWNLPSGAAIVLLGGAMLLAVEGWQRVRGGGR